MMRRKKESVTEIPNINESIVRQASTSSKTLEVTLPITFCEKHDIQKGDIVKLIANDVCIIAPKNKELAMKKLKEALLLELQKEEKK